MNTKRKVIKIIIRYKKTFGKTREKSQALVNGKVCMESRKGGFKTELECSA